MTELKAAGLLPEHVERRQVKDLTTLVEPDYRFLKRLTKPGMSFCSCETASRTLQGYEALHLIRQGQVQAGAKGDMLAQVQLLHQACGIAA